MITPANFLRLIACAALACALGSCSQVLEANRSRTSETLSPDKSIPEVEATGTGAFSQRPLVDLKKLSRLLAYQEKTLPSKGESRPAKLVELARLSFLLGEFGNRRESEQHFEKGRSYAELMCQERPRRVEGYYWLALNLAGLAQVGSAKRGLQMVPMIVERMETALALDETYDQAGPHRLLGRVFCEAPAWPLSSGDIDKSLQHLRSAVQIAPENSTNHLYLAETLVQLGKSQEAYQELQRVLTCRRHAISSENLEDDRQQALSMMRQFDENGQDASAREAGEHSGSASK